MKGKSAAAVAAILMMGSAVASAGTLGPTPYTGTVDSPFSPFTGFTYWYLEDFEDGAFDVAGASGSGNGLCIVGTDCFVGSGLTDSVENGQQGHDWWAGGSIEITFDDTVLGALPNAVGLVWTDGAGDVVFNVYDALNNLLATLTGNSADGSFTGGTAEDRFYGYSGSTGVKRITVTNAGGGIEIDHVQYGLREDDGEPPPTGVPEPGTLGLLAMGLAGMGAFRRRKTAG